MSISYGVKSLSPGTRSLLLRFEQAVRQLEDARHHGLIDITMEKEDGYVRAKKAIVRRLRRLEGTLPYDMRGRTGKENQ